jgi:hypothetical protein
MNILPRIIDIRLLLSVGHVASDSVQEGKRTCRVLNDLGIGILAALRQ